MTTFYLKHTKSGKVDMRTKAGKAWAVLKKNAVKVSRDGNTVWSNYKPHQERQNRQAYRRGQGSRNTHEIRPQEILKVREYSKSQHN